MTSNPRARTLVIMPTFNERQNLERVVERTLRALPDTHILVVDDDSPDGTGALADTLAAADDHIHTMHRSGKQGLGAAYIAGFAWGLVRGYDWLIEMDADGSHPPEALPRMLEGAEQSNAVGLVIGSRWVHGGSVEDWPKRRQLLSRAGNAYARIMLGLTVRDATAGYRIYRASMLSGFDFTSVDSKGYCFQIDLTLRTLKAGYSIAEVPIHFREREFGVSKMSRAIVFEAMLRVTVWGLTRRVRRSPAHAALPVSNA
jgi:dolichol-phosphate mannosyltransferase